MESKTDVAERRLLEIIAEQGLSAGDPLPSEAQLAEIADVSPGTARQAINRLRDRGIVERRRGSGTVLVRSPGALSVPAGKLPPGIAWDERLEFRVSGGPADRTLDDTDAPLSVARSRLGLSLFGKGSVTVWEIREPGGAVVGFRLMVARAGAGRAGSPSDALDEILRAADAGGGRIDTQIVAVTARQAASYAGTFATRLEGGASTALMVDESLVAGDGPEAGAVLAFCRTFLRTKEGVNLRSFI